MQKVNFHSATTKQNGMILILTPTGNPSYGAVAVSLENGMNEEQVLERIKQSFRTLAAGIAEDNRSAA